MRKLLPVSLLLALLVLPALLFAGFALLGERHPLENKNIEDVGFLAESEQKVEIVFFGFAGCSFTCPNALLKIADALTELKQEGPHVDASGIFVDIKADTQMQRAREYGKLFSDDIKGFNVNEAELWQLKKVFSLRFKEERKPDNRYELLHTDHFFILTNHSDEWRIERVLANNTDKEMIKKEISVALGIR